MLALILDVVVLVGLGVTIYYCMRLSKALNAFREHRAEFGSLMQQLSQNILQAQHAVENLKSASFESGDDLQKVINHASVLKEELQLMNEAGDSMASRLEKIAETNRKIAQGLSGGYPEESYDRPVRSESSKKQINKKPEINEEEVSFFIQDREFDTKPAATYEEEMEDAGDFSSKAEQELFDALNKNNRN